MGQNITKESNKYYRMLREAIFFPCHQLHIDSVPVQLSAKGEEIFALKMQIYS